MDNDDNNEIIMTYNNKPGMVYGIGLPSMRIQ